MMRILALIVLSSLFFSCGEDADPCKRVPEGLVVLPDDDGTHVTPLEWWYWTGHLKTDAGHWFGFEEVFFHVRQGENLEEFIQQAHSAVTDIDDDSFHYFTDLAGMNPVVFGADLNLKHGPVSARGEAGREVLHGEADGYVFDLRLKNQKSPVLQHGVGYIDYEFGGNTYYYSRERMDAEGTLKIGDQTHEVTGSAWFDHQWGAPGDIIGNHGWDWFAIQLDDDRELMVFSLRFQGVEALRHGSYTTADCRTTELFEDDISITATGEWTSPNTGFPFPSGWIVEAAGMTLTVTPAILNQELEGPPIYWEGTANVTGDATGRAYVELTGYGY
jgi:predicted secreted hydrolase